MGTVLDIREVPGVSDEEAIAQYASIATGPAGNFPLPGGAIYHVRVPANPTKEQIDGIEKWNKTYVEVMRLNLPTEKT